MLQLGGNESPIKLNRILSYSLNVGAWTGNKETKDCRLYERDTYNDIYFADGVVHVEITACTKST